MGKVQDKSLRFPLLGLHRGVAHAQQPPFSTPACQNVRPTEVVGDRARGGSREGFGKWAYEQLGSAGNRPVRLLASVPLMTDDGFRSWSDTFAGETLGSQWSKATWVGTAPPVTDDLTSLSELDDVGAVRDTFDDLDVSQAYTVEMFILPYQAAHHGSYTIYVRMDDTTPVGTTDGAIATLTMTGTGGVYTGTLDVYVSDSKTSYAFSGGTDGQADPGLFSVTVSSNAVTVTWAGTQVVTQGISGPAGKRIGFGMNCTVAGGVTLVDYFRLQYYSTTTMQERREVLVASADGELWRETRFGKMGKLSTSLTLVDDRPIIAAARYQKLYIADHGDLRVIGTDGVVAGDGVTLTSATVGTGWTALGIDADDDVVQITLAVGDGENKTVAISSFAAGSLTLATSLGGAVSSCTFRVTRGPKIYDPSADTLTLWLGSNGGQIPVDCSVVFEYRSRLFLCSGNQWWASRRDDPLDWDYTASPDDTERAVSGETSEAGNIGADIIAAAPVGDDYVIIGCWGEIWVMLGDPTAGGEILNRSRTDGMISRTSWCYGPKGADNSQQSVFFLSLGGLMMMGGPNMAPESVSAGVIPRELLEIDPDTFAITMEYDDGPVKGILIHLARQGGEERLHWWVGVNGGGFWPYKLQDDHEPHSSLNYNATAVENRGLLFGCQDGYIRHYHPRYETDGGSEIESYVEYGPVRLGGGDFFQGKVLELAGVVGVNGGDVDWALRVADTHEGLRAAGDMASGTWSAGYNPTTYPDAAGGSMILRLSNGSTYRAWAMESAHAVIERTGKQRP